MACSYQQLIQRENRNKQIIDAYISPMSIQEVAQEFGLSINTCWRIIKDAGVSRSHSCRVTDAKSLNIARKRNETNSYNIMTKNENQEVIATNGTLPAIRWERGRGVCHICGETDAPRPLESTLSERFRYRRFEEKHRGCRE